MFDVRFGDDASQSAPAAHRAGAGRQGNPVSLERAAAAPLALPLLGEVPSEIVIASDAPRLAALAMTLQDRGVILPTDWQGLDEWQSAIAIERGLHRWILERAGELQVMQLAFKVHMNFEDAHRFEEVSREQGQVALAAYSVQDFDIRVIKPAFRKLDAVGRALLGAALRALEGLHRVMPVWTPGEAFWNVERFFWHGEADEKEALAQLLEEGMSEDDVDLPKRKDVERELPPWLTEQGCEGRRRGAVSDSRLRAFAKDKDLRPWMRRLAACVLMLREARRLDVSLSVQLEYSQPLYRAVYVFWCDNDGIEGRMLDDYMNQEMQAGEATEQLTQQPIPQSTKDAVEWLQQLDRAFQALRVMDEVIGLITTKRNLNTE